MKERTHDEWNTILFCANFLSTLAAAAAAAVAVSATATTITTMTADSGWTSTAATTTANLDGVTDAAAVDEIACPAMPVDSCSCYVFDDDLYLECPGPTMAELRVALAAFAGRSLRSLSIYNLDKTATTIKADDFARPLRIRQLHISLCNINQLTEDSFRHMRDQLESLAIVSGQLHTIPRKTLPYMSALRAISLEGNQIAELPDYSFYGLQLVRLNLKSNVVRHVSEHAFAGLEETLELVDLSANQLIDFPTAAVRRMRHLTTLKLAANIIRAIPDDGYSLLESVLHVDLASNRFASIGEDAFRALPCLRTLSLHGNGVQAAHRRAFASLTALESLDLSHNELVHLEADTFHTTLRLKTIDLSHNHVHRIDGLFANLAELHELFLGENNVLAVPRDAFANATALNVLHLQRNVVRHIDPAAFAADSRTMRQLRLSENYVPELAAKTLAACGDLVTLNLDRNAIVELRPSAFVGANSLRELRLHDNRITHISNGMLVPLPRLIELHLQRNAIAAIEEGAFGTMHSLQFVDLRENALRKLGNVFRPHATALVTMQLDANGLTALLDTVLATQTSAEVVSLSNNRLTRLEHAHLAGLRSARSFSAANNNVADIEDGAFAGMPALLTLNLNGNLLRIVSAATFAGAGALRELRLASNRLETVASDAFVHLGQLRLLDLSGNRLSELHAPLFHPQALLERLLLHNCQLVAIDRSVVSGLHRLNELDLRANQLVDGTLAHLFSDSLRVLDVSANNLTRLPAGSLDGLPALRDLRIEDGQLKLIESTALVRSINLESLSVRRNRLRQLPDNLFRTTRRLSQLWLDENMLTAMPLAVATLLSLRRLSVAANRIGDTLDVCKLRALRNLTELNVSGNAIATLTGLERCNLTHLLHLDLSANLLTALPEDGFCSTTSLRSINLSTNRFARLPLPSYVRCPTLNLEHLVFENNPVSRIIGGSNLANPSGVTASATNSSMTSISSSYPSVPPNPLLRLQLTELVVEGCANLSAISSADLEPFDRLVHLRLARNAIAHILPGAFQSQAVLVTLDLSENRIVSLSPQRLRGLRSLKSLNLTRNALRMLEPFDEDLSALETLDLSHNQLRTIGQHAFRRLVSLTELRMRGNRIATIAADVFRPLRNLRLLDVAGNRMQSLPLDAFKPLETRLRSLILRGNPLVCGCAQEEAWQWLREHEKMTSGRDEAKEKSSSATDEDAAALRCEEPAELRGRAFLQTEASAFCAKPLLVTLAVRDIRSFSVNVSWQAHDYSRIRAFKIVYQAVLTEPPAQNVDGQQQPHEQEEMSQPEYEDDNYQGNSSGSGQLHNGDARWALVTRLDPGTRYSICIVGLASPDDERPFIEHQPGATTNDDHRQRRHANQTGSVGSPQNQTEGSNGERMVGMTVATTTTAPQLHELWSRCVEVRTLDGDGGRRSRDGRVASLLTRRLGLIVGSCMGCVVFAVLVVVLVYTKTKKQRRNAKHQQPLPPEYLSYRHFSLQGCQRSAAPTADRSVPITDLTSVAVR